MSDTIHIRESVNEDRNAIARVHQSAFGVEQGDKIVQLVGDLFEDETAKPIVSLVAEVNDELIGHVLFTSVSIDSSAESVAAMILAPIGVDASHQRTGVGRRLIRDGLRQLTAGGVQLVFVLGYPDYYGRFGFRPAGPLGIQAPHPIPSDHADAWMVLELTAGAIAANAGTVKCSEVLGQAQHWRE